MASSKLNFDASSNVVKEERIMIMMDNYYIADDVTSIVIELVLPNGRTRMVRVGTEQFNQYR